MRLGVAQRLFPKQGTLRGLRWGGPMFSPSNSHLIPLLNYSTHPLPFSLHCIAWDRIFSSFLFYLWQWKLRPTSRATLGCHNSHTPQSSHFFNLYFFLYVIICSIFSCWRPFTLNVMETKKVLLLWNNIGFKEQG